MLIHAVGAVAAIVFMDEPTSGEPLVAADLLPASPACTQQLHVLV